VENSKKLRINELQPRCESARSGGQIIQSWNSGMITHCVSCPSSTVIQSGVRRRLAAACILPKFQFRLEQISITWCRLQPTLVLTWRSEISTKVGNNCPDDGDNAHRDAIIRGRTAAAATPSMFTGPPYQWITKTRFNCNQQYIRDRLIHQHTTFAFESQYRVESLQTA
jgi:hypothetical protein